MLPSRQDKFPEGENLEELAQRAKEAIAECVLPHLHEDGTHIAITSHGLCIFEAIAAVLRLDADSPRYASLRGLVNTAWSRMQISVKVSADLFQIEGFVPLRKVSEQTFRGCGYCQPTASCCCLD